MSATHNANSPRLRDALVIKQGYFRTGYLDNEFERRLDISPHKISGQSLKQAASLAFWIILGLVLIDITISMLFRYPDSGNTAAPSKLASYFDYGTSTEGKISRMLADDPAKSHPLTKTGWFKTREEALSPPPESGVNNNRILFYGMSFSDNIAKAMQALDKNADIRSFEGPASPLNHSYAHYLSHRPHLSGDMVTLTLLASSLPAFNSMSHMTANYISPSPHFYPRFGLRLGELVSTGIPVHSANELREAMHHPEKWNAIKEILRHNDAFFDPWVYDRSWVDHSTLFRLVRHAWGQNNIADIKSGYHDATGFKNTDQMLDVTRKIISEFAHNARADGAKPLVILVNDQGYSDHLYQAMKPVLEEENIPFYSSHTRFPASNRSNFVADGHFTHEIDQSMARDIQEQIRLL